MLPGLDRYISQGALFNEARTHRYRLWRRWAEGGGVLLWLMLNPSTADEQVLDSTLRKCEGFARRWGYSGFEVANLFALRSPYPKVLYEVDYKTAVGWDANDHAIERAATVATSIVVGWGTEKIAARRAREVVALLTGRRLGCLAHNADGSPMHPLYVPYTKALEEWTVTA